MVLFPLGRVYREITDPATGDLFDLLSLLLVVVMVILCVNVRSRRSYSRHLTMPPRLARKLDSPASASQGVHPSSACLEPGLRTSTRGFSHPCLQQGCKCMPSKRRAEMWRKFLSCEESPWAVVSRDRLKLFRAEPSHLKRHTTE